MARNNKEDEQKRRAIEIIHAHLLEQRANRPSIRLANGRSAKGAQTICDILRAARKVFVQNGHAALSMRAVADEAGIAVGNVNYYFPVKRDLLEAMLREELADYVEEHIRQFEADTDEPLDILLNVVEFYVENARSMHRFFFQMWGYAASDENAKSLIRDLYQPIGRFIYYLVKAANPALSDTRARQIVLQLFSLEEGVKLFIGMGPEDDRALATAERHVRELVHRIIEQ